MHYIRSFEVGKRMFRLIFAVPNFVVKFGALHGPDVRSVAVGNGNTARFKELLSPVKTLRTQLIVSKAAKELRDEDVGMILGGRVPVPHVGADDGHLVPPHLLLLVLQSDHSVGILLHREHPDPSLRGLTCPQSGSNQGTPPSPDHDEDKLLGLQLGLGHHVGEGGLHGILVL